MHIRKVVGPGYWKEVTEKAKRAAQRQAAIAFVTEDLIGLCVGDVLVVNASIRAISSGGTGAELLLALHDKGVLIYNCEDLHAKVLLLGRVAVIGSGNMSDKSNRPAGGWQEAGLITNDAVVFAGVASFIKQLARPRARLKRERLVALTKIKVKRVGGGWNGRSAKRGVQVQPLGNRTWITGTVPAETSQEEERQGEKAAKALDGPTDYMLSDAENRFGKNVLPGDRMIMIWKAHKTSRARVYRSTPVLLKHRVKRNFLVHYRETHGKFAEISWTKFQTLLKSVKYRRRVKPGSVQLMPNEVADAIDKRWKAIARS